MLQGPRKSEQGFGEYYLSLCRPLDKVPHSFYLRGGDNKLPFHGDQHVDSHVHQLRFVARAFGAL